jgi:hypothetical protein
VNDRQAALLAQAVSEAKRDPAFGRELRKALAVVLPRKAVRRDGPVIDVFEIYGRAGEAGLRDALAQLTLDQLKDVIAHHRMDRSQLAMKWKTPGRLIELIAAQTVSRAHKGEAFLGS